MLKTKHGIGGLFALTVAAALTATAPVEAHHSFSIFDSSVTRVFTGVVTSVNPDANHLQIFFAPMNEERKNVIRNADGTPVTWAVEMAGSAASAREGISVSSFPRGTVISVALHPLRNGEPAGNRIGPLFKCPGRNAPEPGKHCDSVEGSEKFGQGTKLSEPTPEAPAVTATTD